MDSELVGVIVVLLAMLGTGLVAGFFWAGKPCWEERLSLQSEVGRLEGEMSDVKRQLQAYHNLTILKRGSRVFVVADDFLVLRDSRYPDFPEVQVWAYLSEPVPCVELHYAVVGADDFDPRWRDETLIDEDNTYMDVVQFYAPQALDCYMVAWNGPDYRAFRVTTPMPGDPGDRGELEPIPLRMLPFNTSGIGGR